MADVEAFDSKDTLLQLASGEREAVADAARLLAQRGVLEAVPALLDVLNSTHDARVRNAVAIALADLRAPEARSHIVALLTDSRIAESRGSLLYALQEGFDYRDVAPLLARLVPSRSFEVRAASAQMLIDVAASLDGVLRREVADILRHSCKAAFIHDDGALAPLFREYGIDVTAAGTDST